jgi:uncharacterized membrane protein YidH (DUF202 family)
VTGAVAPRDRGLQPERTSLAWTRTSLAVLANAAVLLVTEFPRYKGPLPLIEASLVAAVAVITYLVGIRRQRTLAQAPLPISITPRREVQLVGLLVVGMIAIVAIGLYS